jgi:hypothetical protein
MLERELQKFCHAWPSSFVHQDVKLSLSMPRSHKNGAEVQLYSFLTSVLDGGEWLASRPWPLYPRERIPVTTEYKGRGTQWGYGRFGRREKYLAPTGIRNPDRSARSVVSNGHFVFTTVVQNTCAFLRFWVLLAQNKVYIWGILNKLSNLTFIERGEFLDQMHITMTSPSTNLYTGAGYQDTLGMAY